MTAQALPSLATRRQIAIVRSIADEIGRCALGGSLLDALRAQFIEELSRLGCRSLKAAAALAMVDLGS